MQFLILALDATDSEALNRRMAAREAHLAHIAKAKAAGHAKIGAALMDESGKMNGSTIIAEFDTREQFDAWLASDPYVTQKVWDKIDVRICKIAPSFVNTPAIKVKPLMVYILLLCVIIQLPKIIILLGEHAMWLVLPFTLATFIATIYFGIKLIKFLFKAVR